MTKVLLAALVFAASLNASAQSGAAAAKPAPAQTVVGQAQAGLANLVKMSGKAIATPNLAKYGAIAGSGFPIILAKFASNDPRFKMDADVAEIALLSMERDGDDGKANWSPAYASVDDARVVNIFSKKIVEGVRAKPGTSQAAVMAEVLYPSCGKYMRNATDEPGSQACFAASCGVN